MTEPIRVLILCTGNSARSQMAEGLLRDMAGDWIEVTSAGVAPTQVRWEAVEAMKELSIDISKHRSKSIDDLTEKRFDFVITVCDSANQNCPMFPGDYDRIHWGINDPAPVQGDDKTRVDAFRHARDDLRERLRHFIENEARQFG